MAMYKPPHSKDLRKGRYSQNNQIYLVTTVTFERQKIFFDIELGQIVLNIIQQKHEQGLIDSMAYVLMPDHLHWLFALQNDYTLEKVMQLVKGSSAFQINKLRRERGEVLISKPTIWQDGYHDHALRKEEDIEQVARYIIENPLRTGLVKDIADYPLWYSIWFQK
jgi:REP element-mobilizing transposase RayT